MGKWTATKIIATLGPATSSTGMIERLIAAGVNIFRLNFSYGDFHSHLRAIRLIRQSSTKLAIQVGILQDLPGPKIRLGEIPGGAISVGRGDDLVLNCGQVGSSSHDIAVGYAELYKDVDRGNQIFIDDGAIRLRAEKIVGKRILCRVEAGGVISSHKGVNLPGIKISTKSLTLYDRRCVEFGVKHKVDFIAMSFVRSSLDITTLQRLTRTLGGDQFIVAKIEKREALDDFDHILKVTDGVMIARGDLGIEMPIEQVPGIQKRLIAKCNAAGVPVITATQVLESMVKNPRPTRAEASDAANAILDGTDALMLSQETAIGAYPVEAVRVLKTVAAETEKEDQENQVYRKSSDGLISVEDSVARSVCQSAHDLDVRIIATPTRSGHTARLISRFHPKAKIAAFSQYGQTRMHLLLSRGVIPLAIDRKTPFDELLTKISRSLVANRLAAKGDAIIITAGSPRSRAGETNLMVIETV